MQSLRLKWCKWVLIPLQCVQNQLEVSIAASIAETLNF